MDILQDTCDFFGSGLDNCLLKNSIRTGPGYLFDFYNEISLREIQNATNDGGGVFLTKMILSVCAALITNNDNSCYFIVNFFPAKWK